MWGSERALADTLAALTEAWQRVVLVMPPGAELADEIRGAPERYGPIELRQAPIGNLHKRGRLAQLRALSAITRLAVQLRPDRIYLNQAGLARVVLPAARFLGVPLTLHVRIREDIARVTKLLGTALTPLDLIFISDAMADLAGAAPDGGNVRWVKAYDPYRLAAQPKSLPQYAPFVSVGRLSHGKGMHLLVEALGKEPLAGVRTDFYGAGVEGDDYAEWLETEAHVIGANVRFMGFRKDVGACLPAYRFLVSTSAYEPLGRVVMEGWEAGLVPIVYAGSGGAAEMVRKSGAGLCFDDWTEAALTETLVAALQMNPEEHRSMVAAGRGWMAQNLGLDSYRSSLSGIIF